VRCRQGELAGGLQFAGFVPGGEKVGLVQSGWNVGSQTGGQSTNKRYNTYNSATTHYFNSLVMYLNDLLSNAN
jgi:predicted DNA-binding ArsR family transcriptional regulator